MSSRLSVAIGLVFLLASLSAAVFFASQAGSEARFARAYVSHGYHTVDVDTVGDLERLFSGLTYEWPPVAGVRVPPLALRQLPPDIGDILDVQQRKSLFLRTLLPIVLLENRRLRETRQVVELLLEDPLPPDGSEPAHWLARVARDYRVTGDIAEVKNRKRLLERLDEVPVELVLAQAAIESGWGTSRFALEGNSLFGQWTYVATAGLMPEQRPEEAQHFVRSFPSLQASVRSYLHNLNTGRAYNEFRGARAQLRKTGWPLTGTELAVYLKRYSERGDEYVNDLLILLRSPTFAQLPVVDLELVGSVVAALETGAAI